MPKLEDESARRTIGLADADWIDFETTVSTSADQIALAPGYLQREWTENGRRYFHYKMDRPMLAFYCYSVGALGRQARRLERRADRDLLRSQASLQRRSHDRRREEVARLLHEEFLALSARQVRILEFPRYARFAQSFANTIPYSEAIGFIADLRDPEDARLRLLRHRP